MLKKTEYYSNGNSKIVKTYLELTPSNTIKKHVLHSLNDFPAYIEYYENGNVKEKRWYKFGKIHRYVLSSDIYKHDVIFDYHTNNSCLKIDLPAIIKYDEYENVICNIWYKDGDICRDTLLIDIIEPNECWPDLYGEDFKKNNGYDLPPIVEDNRGLIIEKWIKNGVLHRDNDLPAYREWINEGDRISEESWYQNGLLHRENDLPAYTNKFFEANHHNWIEAWFQNGKYYRENNKPVRIHYEEDTNKIEHEIYLKDIEKPIKITKRLSNEIVEGYYLFNIDSYKKEFWIEHREDGPAKIIYNLEGIKKRETWMKFGKIFRDNDLPSEIYYFPNGNISTEGYSYNNRLFRLGYNKDYTPKASIIKYDQNSKIINKKYIFDKYKNRIELTEDTYIKLLYLFRKCIYKYKIRKREIVEEKLKNLISKSIVKEIGNYAY